MNQQVNPWVEDVISQPVPPAHPDTAPTPPPATGVTAPLPGMTEPDAADRLMRRTVTGASALWITGTHGGSGESRLAELIGNARATGHAWPILDEGKIPPRVLLVCRSDMHGLKAAQKALIEWVSEASPKVDLLGLAIMADAPGKLPKPLKDFVSIVGHGAPRYWLLPWVEEWRFDASYSPGRGYQRFLTDIATLIN
jgi:hypothetical protein